jgi:hypothetical protein
VASDHLRVRDPGKHALLNPVTHLHESPGVDDRFAPNHPLVKAHRWAFATDSELADQAEADRKVTAVRVVDAQPVETTEAAPGEVTRRTRRTDRA